MGGGSSEEKMQAEGVMHVTAHVMGDKRVNGVDGMYQCNRVVVNANKSGHKSG